MESLRELAQKNRSYRRFSNDVKIDREELLSLIELTRFAACGANRQALRYLASADCVNNAKIYSTLGWAAYLQDWDGPPPNERPSGYIVIMQRRDHPAVTPFDAGIAAQTILLGAVERGWGGCMLSNVKREELLRLLGLDDSYEILLVIALGKPLEQVVIEELAGGDVKYWRTDDGVHHVPKLAPEQLIVDIP